MKRKLLVSAAWGFFCGVAIEPLGISLLVIAVGFLFVWARDWAIGADAEQKARAGR